MERDKLSPERYSYLSKEDSDLYDQADRREIEMDGMRKIIMELIERIAASCEGSHRASRY